MDHLEDEIEIEAIGVEVSTQPVELYKVLKIADAVSGGGEAKQAISQGYVAVNGELETRKRRKLVDGDLVQFNDEYYLVIFVDPTDSEVFEDAVVDQESFNAALAAEALEEAKAIEDLPVVEEEKPLIQPKKEESTEVSESANPKTGRKTIDFF